MERAVAGRKRQAEFWEMRQTMGAPRRDADCRFGSFRDTTRRLRQMYQTEESLIGNFLWNAARQLKELLFFLRSCWLRS
jgi:hypothetical protein